MSEERGIFIAAIQYVVVGLVTLVPNIYAFIRLVKCKKMRTSYGLMIFGLFAGFGCGFVTAANGISRIVKYYTNNLEMLISNRRCFYESFGVWEMWINFQYACCVLAHSIDRLLVVTNSMFYFAHQIHIIIGLVALSFLPATIIMIILFIREFILPVRFIKRVCTSGLLFAPPAVTYVDLTKFGVGVSSLIIMTLMMILLHQKQKQINAFRKFTTAKNGDSKDQTYNKKQNCFTRVACLVNFCNFAFWILPEIVMFVLENLAHYEGLMFLHHFRAIIKLIYVLNTLNIALSSFIFQQEIRAFLLPGRQMPINATSVFGVTTRLSVPPQPLTSTKASS